VGEKKTRREKGSEKWEKRKRVFTIVGETKVVPHYKGQDLISEIGRQPEKLGSHGST